MKNLQVLSIVGVSVLLLAGGCSSAIQGSMQNVLIETPGAENALCHVMSNGVHYRAYPPQNITVTTSHDALEIRCLAPGDREKTVTVKPVVNGETFGDIATGLVPGLAWDYASGGMFRYPDKIDVDFTDQSAKPEALPAYHAQDIPPPPEYGHEEKTPGWPRLNSDEFRPDTTPQKKDLGSDGNDEAPAATDSEPQAGTPASAAKKSAADLSREYNPAAFSSAEKK